MILNAQGFPFQYSDVYEGVSQTPARSWLPRADHDSTRTLTHWARKTLMSKARVLWENVGLLAGVVGDMKRYSVGRGIKPQSLAPDPEIAKAYQDYWAQFVEICEITQKFNLYEIQGMVSAETDIDGDHGIVLTETETGYPQIQTVRAHRIDSQTSGFISPDGWIDGVRLADSGIPIQYGIRVGDQYFSDPKTNFMPISANSMILHMDARKTDQIRGQSSAAHAVNGTQDIFEQVGMEKAAGKINSAIAMARTGAAPGKGMFGSRQSPDGQGLPTYEQMWGGGAIINLSEGEKIEAFTSDRPSTTFMGFIDFLIRDIATGFGLPPEFVWNVSALGGTANRFILQKAQRRFEERQATIIKMSKRIWGYVMSKGIKRGDIPASDFLSSVMAVHWQTPAKITVDVGREAQQNRADMAFGVRTEAEDAEERGLNPEHLRSRRLSEAIDRIKDAQTIMAKTGVGFDAAMLQISARTPNGNPATETPPQIPQQQEGK